MPAPRAIRWWGILLPVDPKKDKLEAGLTGFFRLEAFARVPAARGVPFPVPFRVSPFEYIDGCCRE